MNTRITATILLLPFLVFTLWVIATEGFIGFLTVAGREPWALQLLLDLVIMAWFAVRWMVRDARAAGRNPWPFVAATVVVGSIAPLIYVVTGSGKSR